MIISFCREEFKFLWFSVISDIYDARPILRFVLGTSVSRNIRPLHHYRHIFFLKYNFYKLGKKKEMFFWNIILSEFEKHKIMIKYNLLLQNISITVKNHATRTGSEMFTFTLCAVIMHYTLEFKTLN